MNISRRRSYRRHCSPGLSCSARRRFATAAVVALALLAADSSASAQQLSDSMRLEVNRVFASWSGADGPGCALGISRNGATLYENGWGMANLETDAPITPASIFHVASVSKQFTAAALMLLAGDGLLSLDDDVRTHIPELPDYGHRITIRHLLTHTSGLRDQWDLLIMARGRFEESRITEADVLEIVTRQKALNFVPGSEYLYSNTGYTLAGLIVRRVSGRSLREFAEERMFQPLGMNHTHFHDDYTMVVKGRAAGYARRGNEWHVSLPNYDTYGATSLFSTVGDLLKWEANYARPSVLTDPVVQAMRTSAALTNGDTTGYGLGLSTEYYRGAQLVGHGGADAGYRTYLGQFPQHGVAIAVLCNAAQANPGALARSVADVVLGDRLDAHPAPVSARTTLSAAQLARLAGVYVHPVTGAPTFVTVRDNALVMGRDGGPQLVPLSDRRFRVAGQPVELEFSDSNVLRVSILTWPPRSPSVLTRQEAVTATRADLEQYAGSYYSEELGAAWEVSATDSTLTLRTRWGTRERTVLPAYADTFAGDYLLRFTRGDDGQVDGMTMNSGRVRGVRFERVR